MIKVLQQKNSRTTRILAILFIFTSAVSAEVVAVPSSGSALNKALARSTSGDTLKLAAGTYRGRFIIPPGVTLTSDSLLQAKIKANGRDRAIILTNSTTISGVDVSGAKIGVYSGGLDNTIEKCRIHHNEQSGISAVGYNIQISDNIIYHNGGSGIQMWNIPEKEVTVEHNTIVFNKNHGLSVGGEATLHFLNNIVAFNSRLTIKAEPKVIILQEFNVYYFNAEINMALPDNNFSFNPMFYAPSKDLYYVTEESHCLKNGKDGAIIGTRIYSHLYY